MDTEVIMYVAPLGSTKKPDELYKASKHLAQGVLVMHAAPIFSCVSAFMLWITMYNQNIKHSLS